jgi:hypothetical protein
MILKIVGNTQQSKRFTVIFFLSTTGISITSIIVSSHHNHEDFFVLLSGLKCFCVLQIEGNRFYLLQLFSKENFEPKISVKSRGRQFICVCQPKYFSKKQSHFSQDRIDHVRFG